MFALNFSILFSHRTAWNMQKDIVNKIGIDNLVYQDTQTHGKDLQELIIMKDKINISLFLYLFLRLTLIHLDVKAFFKYKDDSKIIK